VVHTAHKVADDPEILSAAQALLVLIKSQPGGEQHIQNAVGSYIALGNLGNASDALGDPRRAIADYEQALAIAREIGDRRGEGNHLGNLGNAYYRLGYPSQAIEYHQQALAIAREIGDRRREGNHLDSLGLA